MGEIVIVDTSILLNVLNMPGRNEQREAVLTELEQCIDDGATLLLPLGAVLEIGNHIARLANGNQRRTGQGFSRSDHGGSGRGSAVGLGPVARP